MSIICHRVLSVINLCEVEKRAFIFSVCFSLSLIFIPFVYDLSKLDLKLNDHASVFLGDHTLVFLPLSMNSSCVQRKSKLFRGEHRRALKMFACRLQISKILEAAANGKGKFNNKKSFVGVYHNGSRTTCEEDFSPN